MPLDPWLIEELLLHQLPFGDTPRQPVLKGTELEKASIGQIRLKPFKRAVRIKVSVRRVLLEFASSYPRKKLFRQCFDNLSRLDKMPA
ncbi:MAG: hypothetical protein ACJA16_000141 [Akkermansiaceae bacterium]|jgi:hypothetical protein